MITDKQYIKKIIKITCILLPVIFIFSSCGSKKNEELPFLPVGEDGEISEIRVIIGRDSSLELIGGAEKLCVELTKTVGKNAYVSYEGDVTSKEGATEIWLGYGATSGARGIMRDFRVDDYLCRETDGVIVLGGKSDRATLNAIDRYCGEILPSATKHRLIPEGGGFEHVGDYRVGSATLNGASLNGFVIVINDRSEPALLSTALRLQSRISEKTGYWLDIAEEGDYPFESNGIFLRIEKQAVEGTAYIRPSQSGFELTADGYTELLGCVDKFSELFDSLSHKDTLDVEIDSVIGIDGSSVNLSIASMSIDGHLSFGDPLSVGKVMAEVMERRPDILLTGKLSKEDGADVLKALNGYSPIKDKGGDVYGFAKDLECGVSGVTEQNGVITEYYTVKRDGVGAVLVRMIGNAEKASEPFTISDTVLEKRLPIAVIAQTVGGSVSGSMPEAFVKRHGDSYIYKNEENFFECYTAEEGIAVRSSFNGSGETDYREITLELAT